MTSLLFAGDPHGDFNEAHRPAMEQLPDALILLGDMDLAQPIDDEFAYEMDAGIRVLWIPGNHDFDREYWYDNLYIDNSRTENIHGRVVDVNGVRIAGLGGNFQARIWSPKDGDGEPRYERREDYQRAVKTCERWRKGLPRKARGAIWYEDYEELAGSGCNILVTHEAPSCHQHGFEVLDDLAYNMAAELIVHGHHHFEYDAVVNNISVIGVDKAKTRFLRL